MITLAILLNMRGDATRATALLRESITLAGVGGDPMLLAVASSLDALAGVSLRRGDHERAARLLGAADAIRDSDNARVPAEYRALYQRTVDAVRTRMGDGAFNAAWVAGRALSLEQAIAEALEGATPQPTAVNHHA